MSATTKKVDLTMCFLMFLQKMALALLLVTVLVTMLVRLTGSAPRQVEARVRHKRNLLQLCGLITTYTNKSCLAYNNYGCFCGLGNAASHHVDDVDGCCRVHDKCYGEVACLWMYPQLVGYRINCSEEGCQCTNSPTFSPCAYMVCQCDLQFAQCLGRSQYNHSFRNYDWQECIRSPSGNRPVVKRRRSLAQNEKRNPWKDSLNLKRWP